MKWVTWVLVLALGWFQYSLWLSKGGWRDMWQLEQQVAQQQETNHGLQMRNHALAAEVADLASGEAAIAEIARVDLGYVQSGEIYYRVIDLNTH